MVSAAGATSRPGVLAGEVSGTIRTVRRESLRYTVGGVCYVVGALMLVAPHRLAPATHAIFQPNLPWWGVALLVAGMGMIATTVLSSAPATSSPAWSWSSSRWSSGAEARSPRP
jgi:hypothetical protein